MNTIQIKWKKPPRQHEVASKLTNQTKPMKKIYYFLTSFREGKFGFKNPNGIQTFFKSSVLAPVKVQIEIIT